MTTLKPIVDVKDVMLINNRLFGVPVNHPNDGLNNKQIVSSKVVAVDGDRVETENTMYNVLNWAE